MIHVKQLAVMLIGALCLAPGCDNKPPKPKTEARPGMGPVVTVDPPFEIKVSVDGGAERTMEGNTLAIYEAKPATGTQKQRPQTFDVTGGNFVLAGRLADDLTFAPRTAFEELIGKELQIARSGGDPTAASLSKITLGDDKVYIATAGTLVVEKAFQNPGKYAGVSGRFEADLQQIKLGDPDDPKSPGDQPIGQPVKAKGTFTTTAASYKFEQM